MADLLLLIGVSLVFWSIWYHKRKKVNEAQDLGRLQEEIFQAKKDVDLLIKELAGVSEQVVDTISEKIKVAEETITKLDKAPSKKPVSPGSENNVISILENRHKEKEVISKKKVHLNKAKPQPEVIDNSLVQGTAKHQAVYSLADMGYSIEDIARKLSIGKGEAELILQLKYKGEKVNGI